MNRNISLHSNSHVVLQKYYMVPLCLFYLLVAVAHSVMSEASSPHFTVNLDVY